jgi:transposase
VAAKSLLTVCELIGLNAYNSNDTDSYILVQYSSLSIYTIMHVVILVELARARERIQRGGILTRAQLDPPLTHLTRLALSAATMPAFPPQLKHHILQQYQRNVRSRSFAALARLYGVRGGKQTVQKWYSQWDGTPRSLESKPRSGRPRLLSAEEVNRHIRAPILSANRSHRAVHYPDIHVGVQRKTSKKVSLRTIRRYGKQEAGIKQKHSKKRTASESQPRCTQLGWEWMMRC